MAVKKPLIEATCGRDREDRNDPKWAHPELADFWNAGNSDVVDMCLDEAVDPEKRAKRLDKVIRTSVAFFEQMGYNPYEGTDFMDGGDYGKLQEFECKGSPEDPDETHGVYAVIPDKKKKGRPCIFFVMGGCFYMQVPELYPQLLRWAKRFDAVCVAPKYSTLLDGGYPLQINECHAGYQWMLDNADMLGIDPDNVVMFGLSTGAQLAASLAFRLKRYGITPKGCVLCDPMIEDRCCYPSSWIIKDTGDARLAHKLFLGYVGPENVGMSYLGPEAFANHATVDECRGLCPMTIMVGESDQDRDVAIDFAGKLLAADVACSLHIWRGAAHATLFNSSGSDMSDRFFEVLYGDISDFFKYDFRRPWTA
jgi:acetyl esterase/lipase